MMRQLPSEILTFSAIVSLVNDHSTEPPAYLTLSLIHDIAVCCAVCPLVIPTFYSLHQFGYMHAYETNISFSFLKHILDFYQLITSQEVINITWVINQTLITHKLHKDRVTKNFAQT
jgi:hypothetical protein